MIDINEFYKNHEVTLMLVGLGICILITTLYFVYQEFQTKEIREQIEDSLLVQWCSRGCSHMMILVGEVHNSELSEKCLKRCIADVENE